MCVVHHTYTCSCQVSKYSLWNTCSYRLQTWVLLQLQCLFSMGGNQTNLRILEVLLLSKHFTPLELASCDSIKTIVSVFFATVGLRACTPYEILLRSWITQAPTLLCCTGVFRLSILHTFCSVGNLSAINYIWCCITICHPWKLQQQQDKCRDTILSWKNVSLMHLRMFMFFKSPHIKNPERHSCGWTILLLWGNSWSS